MLKFYFAGSIRGGRDKVNTYIKINDLLKKYGVILDEHVANPNVDQLEKNNSKEEIYTRDVNWIKECDYLIAEVSVPSLGVGYEIAYAEKLHKPIICVYDESINISAMITGNQNLILIKYQNTNDLLTKLENQLQSMNK